MASGAPQDVLSELRPGQSVELLQELHILTRDGRLNQDSRRKLKQVYHLFNFIEPLLAELSAGDPSVCLIEAAESLLDGLDLDQLNVDEIAAALHTKYAEHLR